MKNLARELLFLKKGERRALFTVCILLFLSLGFRIVIPNIEHTDNEPDTAFLDLLVSLRQELDSMEKYSTRNSDQQVSTYNSNQRKNAYSYNQQKVLIQPLLPHRFDPNSASHEELSAMHLPERVISNLISYRKAGGIFYTSDDIGKIYGLEDSIFNILKDYVSIESSAVMSKTRVLPQEHVSNDADRGGANNADWQRSIKADWHRSNKADWQRSDETKKIELNAADSAELVRIRGIGPFSAQTIIRYRSLLGGYYSLSQLREVYGMDSSRYDLLCNAVYIDSSAVNLLDINELSYRELLRHPYISKQQVNDLIQYRDYAKVIVSPNELKKFGILDSASYERIAPYIRCRIN